MGISAVSGSTSLETGLTAQTAQKAAATAKTAGGGGKASSATASASTTSGTSGTSNDNKIYDKRDTNKDGTVSYEEAIQYALQHPDEAARNEATAPAYTQKGKTTATATGTTSTINLAA